MSGLGRMSEAKETGASMWLLTLGIVTAALVGMYFSYRVQAWQARPSSPTLFGFKDQAWRRIFWVSLPPGVLFVLGSLFVTESAALAFQAWKKDAGSSGSAALAHSGAGRLRAGGDGSDRRSGWRANVLGKDATRCCGGSTRFRSAACIILFCNTAYGVNRLLDTTPAFCCRAVLDLQRTGAM